MSSTITTTTQAPLRDEATPTDLGALFARLAAARWWLIASVVLCTAAFVTVALIMKPVYRAEAVLISASLERNSISSSLNSVIASAGGGLAGLVGLGGASSDAATEEALAVLKSREFMEGFIRDLNLMPKLFAKRWDSARGTWKVGSEQPTPAKAAKYFKKIFTVTQDKKTNLLTLQIDWKNREEAASWVNEIAARLNAEMRSRAIEQADASVSFLEKELAATSTVEIRDSINRLIEAQIKQRMLANVTREYAFRVVDRALPPDADDPVRPQKLMLFALGPLVGLVLGIVAILGLDMIRPKRRSHV